MEENRNIEVTENEYSVCTLLSHRSTKHYLFTGDLEEDKEKIINKRRTELFSKFGIDKFAEVKISDLSTGMKQKVSIVVSLIHNPDILFFPDEGAMKRYSDSIGMQYAFGMKRRDWNTGAILGLDIINKELVRGRDVLIIDDICSRGGTFLHSAKALKEAGAKSVFLAITHAEDTMVSGGMYNTPGLIDHIFTTNSLFTLEDGNEDKISVYDL